MFHLTTELKGTLKFSLIALLFTVILDSQQNRREGIEICHKPPPPHMYAAAAKSLQSCLTLCDPIDGSPPGSPVPGILQARTLEWVAISFSTTHV